MKKKFVLTFAIAITSLTLSACSGTFGSTAHDMMDGMTDGENQSAAGNSQYNAAALMFASMMIPHHEQALVMADMALKISDTPEVLELAAQIKAAQAPEIEQMQSWIDTQPGYDNGHSDQGMMDGMLGGSQLTAMSSLAGAAFDKAFLVGMIAHHEGALLMAEMITGSSNSEVKALGEEIIKTQTAEIALMKSLLQ